MAFWKFFYNWFVVPSLFTLFHLGKFFNKKIRRGIEGRTDLFPRLQAAAEPLTGRNRIWFHASSLGEFEQAKPIIAEIKEQYPDTEIITTFFSPSGLDNSKNYKLASIISYIPFDTKKNADQFIAMVKPTAAIILRYDVWPNMIWSLSRHAVPTIIVNATMKTTSNRLIWGAKHFHQLLYNNFRYILTVSESDRKAFSLFGTTQPVIAAIGDTRFDQVKKRSDDAKVKHILNDAVTSGRKVFIVGQSWGEDEEVILPVLYKIQEQEPSLLTIIVPHEPTIKHLDELENALEGNVTSIRFSEMNNYQNEQVILIDSIGILVALYKYAQVAYVGGSFRQGIHNVLEPAVFGLPVIFGPRHTNSQEAVALMKRGGAFVAQDEKDLYRLLRTLLHDSARREQAGNISRSFVEENCGATGRFMEFIQPYITP